MSSILTCRCLHGTPWPQCDVRYCSVPAQHCQHRCLRSLQNYLSLPLDRTHALSFCVTRVLTSSHPVPSSCGSVQSARIPYPCFPRPRLELGRAFPNELDRHVPSGRGLLDHPSQCSQCWPIDTICVVTIRRASDHHVTAPSMVRPRADLTDIANSLHLRLHNPMLDSGSFRIATAFSFTPCRGRSLVRILLQWQSMATSNTLCSAGAEPLVLFPLERLGANLSFNLGDSSFSAYSLLVRLSRRPMTCCSPRRISLAIFCQAGRRTTHTVQRQGERPQTDSVPASSLLDPCS